MKLTLLLLLDILAYTLVANGQLAVIRDADGFTNVRQLRSATSKIIGKFHDGDVFSYGEERDGWVNILYWPADSAERVHFEGYIHKDRLLPIAELHQWPDGGKTFRNGHFTIRHDSVTIELISAPFKPKQHVLKLDEHGLIEKIDRERPLGTDGEMPLEELTSLRMTIAGQPVDIPAAAWGNLYDANLGSCNVLVDSRTGYMYIHLANTRSAAGGYEIVWIFKDYRYVKRYVDQSNN